MSDILSSALLRLSGAAAGSTLSAPGNTQAEPLDPQAKGPEASVAAPSIPEPCVSAPLPPSGEVEIKEVDVTVVTTSTIPPAPQRTEMPTAPERFESGRIFLQAHSRKLAAAVVVACMLLIWIEGNSTSDKAAQSIASAVMDVESMLNEFEMVPSQPLQEPAEPVETVSNSNAPLIIPADAAQGSRSESASEFSVQSAAIYPTDASEPVSSAPSNFEAQQTTSKARSVHFTGQIQPLKQ
jgi:hypothetical protein